MARPGDVIAGGLGCMGHIKHMPNIYLTYTRYIPFSNGICPVYVWYMKDKIMTYDDLWYMYVVTLLQTIWMSYVPVTLLYISVIFLQYDRNIS